MKSITIKDVARAAKVSTQTVSRAVSGKGYVSAATARKVQRAVDKLGYAPNRIASSLSSNHSLTIGMVVPDVSSPFFSEVVLGAQTAASQIGYNMILCNTAEDVEQERKILKFLGEARVDGVIMAGARLPARELHVALSRHRAFVSINRPIPHAGGLSVVSLHAQGMALAVEHLIKIGRRNIAYMAGPESVFSAQERLRGFRRAMKAAGLPVPPHSIVPYRSNLEEGNRTLREWLQTTQAGYENWSRERITLGRLGARALLSEHSETDALACYSDQLAFGALQACAELGRRVPQDVAIVGCNDVPLATQATPALTTQRVPMFQMGARAAQLLVERLAGRIHQETTTFPHELIIRASAPSSR